MRFHMFINNLPAYGACQQRTPRLFVQGTANFPFRGWYSKKIIQHVDNVSNLLSSQVLMLDTG